MAIQRIILDALMLDGTEHTGIVITSADRIKGESTGRRQKWGTLDDSPNIYSVFWAYAALSREGKFAGSFDDFVQANEVVTEAGREAVDPTVTATLGG